MSAAESRDLRRWLAQGAQAVKRARERLDAINVFPVADADTGTNMYLTLHEGNRAVAKLPPNASHREVVAAFARGALVGARGNSGVIVSQYLSAFLSHVDRAGGLSAASPAAIAAGLQAASEAAYRSVGAPVEGTILSVAQAASDAAAKAVAAKERRNGVLVAAVVGAREALKATVDDLPAAQRAGVVDAGAAGLVLQLEMLAETLAGPAALDGLEYVEWELASTRAGVVAVPAPHDHGDGGGAYEVMFVARVDEARGARGTGLNELTAALSDVGDSVAVTGSHGLIQAHVHTDAPGAAVDTGIDWAAHHIVVRSIGAGHAGDAHGAAATGTGMVALTSCPGLAALLADAGAVVLVVPDPALLKRRELRRAVRDASGRGVVVVAGNPALRAVADSLARHSSGRGVVVVPAEHEAQVIAAVAAGALVTPGEPLAEVMRAAVAKCSVASSSSDALDDDVDRLVTADTVVVSLILARGVPSSVTERVRLSVAGVCPTADVQVYQGDHGSPGILVGVERA